ncbi:MAG: integrase family protein, partial [Marmoricola sp.]|nr:integrase family protein [Marmoricola sp.]
MSRSSASRPAQEKRGFGQVSKMRSGRYQARYTGPDGGRHSAPTTFEAKEDAVAWLRAERPLVEDPESWEPPKVRLVKAQTRLTFDSYADKWLEERPLKPRTRAHYRRLLDVQLFPTFGDMDLTKITTDVVNHWYALMGPSRPALRAHAYALLRTILSEVEQDELISKNPCHIRGAGNTRRVHRVKPASLDELTTLVSAMPQRLQAMTLLAAWCGLRFGELTELRRKDVDLKA